MRKDIQIFHFLFKKVAKESASSDYAYNIERHDMIQNNTIVQGVIRTITESDFFVVLADFFKKH